MMKKGLQAAFTVNLYLVQVFVVLTYIFMPKPITTDYQIPVIAYILVALLLLSVVLAVCNIVCAIKNDKRMASGQAAAFRSVLGFKLALIPFFIIHFVMWLIFALGSFNPFMMFLWILIPIGIGYAYIALLVTSAYAITGIIALGRQGVITKRQAPLHIVLQLIFVLDVIDGIYLARLIKRRQIS